MLTYIDKDQFDHMANEVNSNLTGATHWNSNRWAYHAIAITIMQMHKPASCLELGSMGIKLARESDEMDYSVIGDWPTYKPKFNHDAKAIPWPIADKAYDFFVALRVFHHLAPYQADCFQEARRIAKNIIIVVPDKYPSNAIGSQAISADTIEHVTGGITPTFTIDSGHGVLYFWDSAQLNGN